MTLKSTLIRSIKHRFNLNDDKASPEEVDASIRSGVNMEGSNLWILMLAIVIASVGLNVNSTAVIIGAMLISPLMGPINGVGYGLAIYDFALIRKSLTNLGVATLISLMASTLYFVLTPLSQAHSEILARTQPTIWDVIIAFTGGLAGIIGATRKSKTNVIPGVAIATALMPPLCTAGYGLASLKWSFFFGAGYLFLINCVFIALASVLIISTSHLPHKKFVNQETETKIKRLLGLIVFVMLVPSTYLAYKLVKEEVFTSNVKAFISNQVQFDESHITEINIDPKHKEVELTLIGGNISQSNIDKLKLRLNKEVDPDATLIMHQAGQEKVDTLSLKSSILNDLYKDSQVAIDSKNKEIEALKTKLEQINLANQKINATIEDINLLFPQVSHVAIGNGLEVDNSSKSNQVTIVLLTLTKALKADELQRIHDWLGKKLGTDNISLVTEVKK
ncbi:MAG: TIGR00341 family protein [Methylophilus sp.]|jgi:uncharacterized hydrophobic protein (TIGR00271 family)